jgi:hypothetical protein
MLFAPVCGEPLCAVCQRVPSPVRSIGDNAVRALRERIKQRSDVSEPLIMRNRARELDGEAEGVKPFDFMCKASLTMEPSEETFIYVQCVLRQYLRADLGPENVREIFCDWRMQWRVRKFTRPTPAMVGCRAG